MHAVKYLLWWWWWSLLLRLSYLVTKVILKMKCGIFFLYAYSLTTACTLIPGWNSSCLSSYCSLWSLTPLGRLVGGYMPARESLLSSSSSNQLCIHWRKTFNSFYLLLLQVANSLYDFFIFFMKEGVQGAVEWVILNFSEKKWEKDKKRLAQ